MPNLNEPIVKQEGRSLRFHLIAALVIFVVDALFFGQGLITLLVAAAFSIACFIKTLTRVIKGHPFSRVPILKAGIYGLCLASVVSTIIINNKIAKNRAEQIVSAVKQYKMKYHRYPDSLQALVPEFLPSVPLAKCSFAFNDFKYWRREGKVGSQPQESATLLYVSLPPFGHPTYHFEQHRWGYID